MCDDSREITVNSPLFVAFIASGKGSFIFLLCVFRDPLFALYANSALSAREPTTVWYSFSTNMVIIISLFQMLCLAIFTDSFLRDMFRCLH